MPGLAQDILFYAEMQLQNMILFNIIFYHG